MKKKVVIPVVLLAAVAAGMTWWLTSRGEEGPASTLEASGTVEATEAQLGFPLGGRLVEVSVQEGDRVEAGAPVARLETAEMEARRRQAEAQIAAARARLEEMERGFRSEEIEQARAAAQAVEVRLEDARADLARSERLLQGGAVSRESYDKAQVRTEVAERELERAQEQLQLLRRGPRREQIAAQRALVAHAEATLEAVEATLADMAAEAPFAGRVTVRHRDPGEVLSPGAPVVTLTNLDDRWVRIYVREDKIGALRLGAPCTIRSDTYPDKEYRGRIRFIASEAEFTPKNVQTQEERVRLVYAVKVQVEGDAGYELKPGMPVDVWIDLAPAGP